MCARRISRREFIKLLGSSGLALSLGALGSLAFLDSKRKEPKSSVPGTAIAQSTGSWEGGQDTSTIAIHASYLHSGLILYIAGSGFHESHLQGPFEGRLLDPQTGIETNVTMPSDLFCHVSTHLANGNLLIAGGTLRYDVDPNNCNGLWHGLAEAFEYDVESGTLIPVQPMAAGRWYPTLVTLADGKTVVHEGFDEYGATNKLVEIYDPGTKSWSIKYDPTSSAGYCVGEGQSKCPGAGTTCFGGTAGKGVSPILGVYPRMHLLGNGLTVVAGMNKEIMSHDPVSGKFTFLTTMSTRRNFGTSVLLPMTNVLGKKGKVLVAGGSEWVAGEATKDSQIIDFDASSTNVPVVRTVQPLAYGRKYMLPVILPDGKVVLFGGSSKRLTNYVYYPEMFDPVTETWVVLPSAGIPRTYHGVALLLSDGRVWVAGSTPALGIWELRTEIFRPWYCGETRPTISETPIVEGYGGRITITTPDASSVASVSLLRLMSTTHHYDANQRMLWLQIIYKMPSSVVVSAPLNGNLAPPGYYMIHVLNNAGVPSIAKIIKIPGTASGGSVFYDVPHPGDAAGVLYSGGYTRFGEEARTSSALLGKSLRKWTVYLKKSGSPTGQVTAVVRRAWDDTVVATFGNSLNAASLSTSFAPFAFSLPTAYTIKKGDRILVQYSGPSRVQLSMWNQDKFNGSSTRRTRYSPSAGYSGANLSDIAGTMASG